MASLPHFDFDIDDTQWRQGRDRIGFSAAGDDFNTGQYYSNSWIDPITSTLFLRPVCLEPTFYTSNTAPYDKLGKTDFGITTGWTEADWTGVGGGKALQKENPTLPLTITSTTTWPKNTGFYVSQFGYSTGARSILFECGYGSSLASNTAIRVYSDGFCEVWRGGFKVTEGDTAGAKGGSEINNQRVEILLIPCRHRELLVIGRSTGNGIRAIFDDITEDDTDPIITENATFWIKVYSTPNIQVAPLKFATSGYACSKKINLAEAPPTSAPFEATFNPAWATGNAQVYGDKSYRTGATDAAVISFVKPDGTTAFVANGTDKDLRIKVSMTGDGLASPAIYGVYGGYKATSVNTNATEKASLNSVWTQASFEVPEIGGPSFTLETINPNSSGVIGLYDHDSKPLKISLGTTVVHDGVTQSPHIVESTAAELERVSIVSDPHITQALKEYVFRERMIFDGLTISHNTNDCLIRRLIKLVGGSDSDMSLETATVKAGDIAPALCGDASEMADIGENAWEYLTKIIQDYLGGWWFGEYPGSSGMVFTLKSPATITGAASKFTFYATTAAAISAGVPSADAWRHVYRQSNRRRIRPESNEIVVTAFDPRFQYPVQSVKSDTPSKDATLKPSLRPTNWIGGTKRLGVINKGINRQSIASAACTLLFDRVSPSREIREIEVELTLIDETTGFPLWVSDRVTIDGVGDFTVASMRGNVEKDTTSTDAWVWRPATLCLSNIIGHSEVSGFHAVVANALADSIRNTIARRGYYGITRGAIGSREIL